MRFDNKLLLSMTAALVPLLVACPAQPPAPQEVPKSAVVKAFSASPAEVAPGESATLTWEVEDTKSVSITTLNGEPIPVPDPAASKGTVAVEVEATTVYVLTAHGEGGSDTAVSSVLVRQNGESIFCTITPQEIEAGQPVTLVWNAAGAGQVSITNAEGEEIYAGAQVQGSKTITPSFSTTYTCAADSKSVTTTLQVNPKIVAFEANASSIDAGGTVTLRWKVGGAQSVSLRAEGRELFSSNTPAEIADGTFTETVPSNLPANAVLTYRLDASAGETTLSRVLEVYVGANPRFVQLVVPPYAREAGVFNVEWKTEQANQVFVLVDGKPVYVATAPAEVAQGVLTLASPATQLQVELKATNARGGETVSAKYTVGAVGAPALNGPITATPAVIANGGEVTTLSWSISNARRVRVLDGHGDVLTEVTGTAAEAGTLDVYPNEGTTFYTVEADNQAGDAILPAPTVAVDVTSPATLTWASPEFPEGGPIVVAGHTAVNAGDVYGLPSVVKNAQGEAFVDIRQSGTPVKVPPETGTKSYVRKFGGEMSALVHGVRARHDSVSVNVNGYLVFSTKEETGWDDNTPNFPKNQLPPLAIAPYFDDLIAKRDGSSEIFFQTDGTGLNRRLIVQWDNFSHANFPGSLLTFQAQVYESGKIVFAYKTLQRVDGNDPGVGVVNDDKTGGLVAPDFPAEGDTYTFFGPATLPLTMGAIDAPWSARIQVGTTDHYINVTAAPPTYLPPVQ